MSSPKNYKDTKDALSKIDWTSFGVVSSTLFCICGGKWRGHGKATVVLGRWKVISKDPCPRCGKHDTIRRMSGDVERMTLG